VGVMRGLEIGPLANPRVRKDQGPVRYLDHADATQLREKYADNRPMRSALDRIIEVDYVIEPGKTISQTVANDAPFDYVIASHVIEHIPDLIGWMADISSILEAGGILSLVIPDKRYSFDVNRSISGVGDLVDAYLRRLHRPTFRDIFNFHSQIATMEGVVDTAGLWAGTTDYKGVVRTDVDDPDVAAFQICRDSADSGEFVDVHCHIFTPQSFLSIFGALVRLDLTDFEIAAFVATQVNTLEFHVSLRKVASGTDRAQVRKAQLASIPFLEEPSLSPIAELPSPETAETHFMEVSELERSILLLKRRVMHVGRRLLREVRRR